MYLLRAQAMYVIQSQFFFLCITYACQGAAAPVEPRGASSVLNLDAPKSYRRLTTRRITTKMRFWMRQTIVQLCFFHDICVPRI